MTLGADPLKDLLASGCVTVTVESSLVALDDFLPLARLLFQECVSPVTYLGILVHDQSSFLRKIERPGLNFLILDGL